MKKPGNFLSINCTENRHIGSLENLKIRIQTLIKDNHIKNYKLVNRYNTNIDSIPSIDEITFLKVLAKNYDYYVEFRNDEIVIFNNLINNIEFINKGRAYLQHKIQSLFYLNFEATLNTKKTW
ncbi:Uncharacterised protein, partial [Mycoplasma putrefaciens]